MGTVFNFSGVYREAPYSLADSSIVDLQEVEGTSCYCDAAAAEFLRGVIRALPPVDLPVNLLDSGDYHYMTALMMEKMKEPFSLMLLDNHPDMQVPAFGADILSCGGWVRWALDRNPLLRRVLIVGIDRSLAGETGGYEDHVTVLSRELRGADIPEEVLLGQVETWLKSSNEPVYLSIDKDVLSPQYASADWDQGTMTLAVLEKICSLVTLSERLAGVDICGELPPAKGGNINSYMLNAEANRRIIAALGSKAVSMF